MSVLPRPGLISFARGVPAPETFPIEALALAARRAIERHGPTALNYGDPAGFTPLREWLAIRHAVSPECILLTPGSIMGLGFLTCLIQKASGRAAVEAPTYDRMLSQLRRARVGMDAIVRDADGLDLAAARHLFGRSGRPSFFYTMPTFHNPTGMTMTLEQRNRLAELVAEFEVTVVEDDPYGLLRIDGEALPRLHDLLRQRGAAHLAILVSSFSKTVAPGLRVGYMVVPEAFAQPLKALAVAAYVSPPVLPQAELYEYLSGGDFEPHLDQLRHALRLRRDAMLQAFDESMPPDVRWTRPEGGYFLWLELPQRLRASELMKRAAATGVALVPGSGFYAGSGGDHAARLSYSFPPVEAVRRGAEQLAALVER